MKFNRNKQVISTKKSSKGEMAESSVHTQKINSDVVINLETKSRCVEKPVIEVKEMANTTPKPQTRSKSHEQKKVKSSKPKSVVLTPIVLFNHCDDVADTNPLKHSQSCMMRKAKRYSESPKKSKPHQPMFQPNTPQSMSTSKKPFSPSNLNKCLTVAEIIEGWPFKSPLKNSIIDANRRNRSVFGVSPSKNNTTKNVPAKNDANKENQWDKKNEWNKENDENMLANDAPDERYPKSMYISPFFNITGRRPINTRKKL